MQYNAMQYNVMHENVMDAFDITALWLVKPFLLMSRGRSMSGEPVQSISSVPCNGEAYFQEYFLYSMLV